MKQVFCLFNDRNTEIELGVDTALPFHHQLLLVLNSWEKGKDLQYLMELSPVWGWGHKPG